MGKKLFNCLPKYLEQNLVEESCSLISLIISFLRVKSIYRRVSNLRAEADLAKPCGPSQVKATLTPTGQVTSGDHRHGAVTAKRPPCLLCSLSSVPFISH